MVKIKYKKETIIFIGISYKRINDITEKNTVKIINFLLFFMIYGYSIHIKTNSKNEWENTCKK